MRALAGSLLLLALACGRVGPPLRHPPPPRAPATPAVAPAQATPRESQGEPTQPGAEPTPGESPIPASDTEAQQP